MHKAQAQVAEFHKAFGVDAPEKVQLGIRPSLLLLRCRLITEEAAEFVKAASDYNLTEMADAIADLLYVTYGTAVSLGIDIEPIFDEVHRSNMDKLDSDGKPIIDASGKVLKPKGWTAPEISIKLAEQINEKGHNL